MSLVGTYTCKALGATLKVTSANDSNGEGAGSLTLGGTTVNVSLHYHFENSVGPITNISIWGNQDDPNFYVGGAGVSNAQAYTTIQLSGAMATTRGVTTFGGLFDRG